MYWECRVQNLRRKKDSDSTFYHNTMQTLHNSLGARKGKFVQFVSQFATKFVYARLWLRCWNFSLRFHGRCERLLALRVMGKCPSNLLFPMKDWQTLFTVFNWFRYTFYWHIPRVLAALIDSIERTEAVKNLALDSVLRGVIVWPRMKEVLRSMHYVVNPLTAVVQRSLFPSR